MVSSAHSRMGHVAPPNCNGAGKCAVPDAQGSRRIPAWESAVSLRHCLCILFSLRDSMILDISTIIFIFSINLNGSGFKIDLERMYQNITAGGRVKMLCV